MQGAKKNKAKVRQEMHNLKGALRSGRKKNARPYCKQKILPGYKQRFSLEKLPDPWPKREM